MRVLLAAKFLHFPQGGGGLERNTHELCLRLIGRGVTPAVMCNLQPQASWLAVRHRIRLKLQPWVKFPMEDGLGYRVYRGWANNDGAREVVGRFKPDIVVTQSAELVTLVQSFAGLGIPRMAYFHEVERVWEAAPIAAMGDVGLIANSQFTAEKMAEHCGFVPPVIRPLIDRSFYLTQTRPRNALFVNTHPKKGLELALQLAESRPDVRFDFVKSWAMTPERSQALDARARAAGNITLHAPTNDMRPHYARARLLVAPSQWEEAWGRVATEAQINGIPVLGSRRGGLTEAIGPGGILVDHDAPIDSWRSAFAAIWDDPAAHARLAEAALNYSIRTEIQPETIVSKFISITTDNIKS